MAGRQTTLLWLFLGFFCGASVLLARAPEEAKLTPAQKKQIQQTAAEFRKSKDTQARLDIIRLAGDTGVAGVEPLMEIVAKELNKELAAYRAQYMKAAGGAAVAKLSPEAAQEITEIRARLKEMTAQEGLTKETIVAVGDPGIARLKELILIDRERVLARDPKLVEKRAALAKLGEQWEACAAILKGNSAAEDDSAAPKFETYLAKEEEIATALALPMDDRTRQTLAANAQIAAKLDPEEARCILDLNLTRNLLGLSALQIDPSLVLCARDHSKDMSEKNFFSHESPVPGKQSFTDRARNFKTSASGENIAAGPLDGGAVNLMWWHSPGHHKNMLGGHKRVGVGRFSRHWTELFGG